MKPIEYKTPLAIRGDSLYCPLPLALDTYYTCEIDCYHCYFRRLNHVWGNDLRVMDKDNLLKKLRNGLNNKNPRSSLGWALKHKKTIRIGNKTDPFQPIESTYKATKWALRVLNKMQWTYVVQTRITSYLQPYEKIFHTSSTRSLVTLLPIVSPGLDRDWEILERGRTTPPEQRLKDIAYMRDKFNIPVGVNGEPFIPGFHTIKDFENALKLLKSYKINRYNTYSFHFNDFVAKRLHSINVDIEKIWYYNRDEHWKPILQQLLDLSKKYNIILGCPDFVNSGIKHIEQANTCCGIDVPNPCTFNTHFFKKTLQLNPTLSPEDILQEHWDGIGDYDIARKIVTGEDCEFYTLKDAGLIKGKKGIIK